jgi:hypothetical protein
MEAPLRRKDKSAADGASVPGCRLAWLRDDDGAWRGVYAAAQRPALSQYGPFGAAYAARIRHNDRRALVMIDGAVAGAVQVFEAALGGGVFQSVALDHGPVWAAGRGGSADSRAFFAAFGREYPARPGRRRRVIPALADGPETRAMMESCGFRHSAGSGYQTAWIDLHNDTNALRAALRPNWRAMADRAVRAGLRVEWDDTGRTLGWLLRHEAQARRAKGYTGPSAALVQAAARRLLPLGGVLTGRALLAGRPVAGLLFLLHPPAATYQIGWTGPEGRRSGAQNLLLWDGIRILKQRDIGYLDMGGMNDGPARSVKYFKEGLGGETVTQPGLYR